MIIIDTGFIIALSNRSDKNHGKAKSALKTHSDEGFITTLPVITEICHLLSRARSAHAQNAFIKSLAEGAIEIFDIGQNHLPEILKLMKKYQDLPMDLADATLVILAQHLKTGRILSTDRRDFKTYRWKNHKPFENLLLD